jgi:hypothetical protein
VLNPTSIGGTTNYTYVDQSSSIVVYDVAGTTVTGGKVLRTVTVGNGGSRDIQFNLGDIELLPNDVLVVTGQVTSGASSALTAAITWKEDK